MENPDIKTNRQRRISRKVQVGNITIGGDSPVSVQSMTRTKTHDVQATIAQILQLQQAGCDIVRVAVPDALAARALSAIKQEIKIPLVADIHFNHELALLAIDAGADKIRLNPGNIGDHPNIQQVINKARDRNIPIRIGVNAGSLEKDVLKKYGAPCAEALVESMMRHVQIYEHFDFDNLVLSLKSSDVNLMIDAYQLIASKTDYPLHLGVTEAGTSQLGTIKSAIGIGALLKQGIGDTIRVSLTADPIVEVRTAIDILSTLNFRRHGVNLISCPGCGRSEIELLPIVHEFEDRIAAVTEPITVAIMGCVVNGPGEAKVADIGVAGGRHQAVLFKRGQVVKTIHEKDIVTELLNEISDFQ